MRPRSLLESLERASVDPLEPALAYLAAPDVGIGAEELNAARRRSLLVLAAGGDPHRELSVGDKAVRSLAADLELAGRRESLTEALRALRSSSDGLERVSRALDLLLADPALAWAWLACALLADELAEGAR